MTESPGAPQGQRCGPCIVVALAVILVVPLVVGAVYQHIAEHRDAERFPPPGDLVDAGGFRLHLHCDGAGSPPVVVETGLGDYSIGWRDVQSQIAQRTRICTYDRAGTGWSEFDRQAPTSQRVVRNLRVVLRNAGVVGPHVLVGHSAGGAYVRAFAARHPEDVVGIVLIDSAHENQRTRMPAALRSERDPLRTPLRVCRVLAPLGIVRALELIDPYVPASLPDDERAMRLRALYRTHACAANGAARRAFLAHVEQREPPASLGDLPLIVLTRGLPDDAEPGDRPDALRQWESVWLELLAELAALSTRSEHRIVDGAGHFIHLDRPDAVIDAIEDVIAMGD